MEDGSLWEGFYDLGNNGGANPLSLLPRPQVNNRTLMHPVAQSGNPQSSDLTEANLGRQVSDDVARDRAKKKRIIDKAYRDKCREAKTDTKKKMDKLTEENGRLRTENDLLKKEEAHCKQTLQSQEEEMRQLKKKFHQLTGELDKQNTVVDVLSKQLAGSKDIDVQRENARLKCQNDLLVKKLNDPENLNIIQLQETNAQLEHEKSALKVIIDALCEKINDDKDHEQERAR